MHNTPYSLIFLPFVCQTTRFRQDDSPSLLDLVFTSEQDMISDLSYLPPLGNSDHICIEFNLVCYSEHKESDNVKYNVRAASIDLLRQSLGSVNWGPS